MQIRRQKFIPYHSLSPHQSLRSLFLHNITVNHIAELLEIVEGETNTTDALSIMKDNGYDCLGVEADGKVVGYMERKDLGEGLCKTYIKSFLTAEVVSDSTSLLQTLYLLKDTKRIFVIEGNQITKLVTHADLQKPPVQLYLFGQVSLVEMYLLQLIKQHLPNNTWKIHLDEQRLNRAKQIFQQRQSINEQIELIDCLQLCDKRDIVISSQKLFHLLPLESKNKGERYFRRLEQLRNNLAHAQDFTNSFRSSEIITIVEQTERILRICEELLGE